MKTTSIAAVLLVMVCAAAKVWGYVSDYCPFEQNQHLKLFPIHKYDMLREYSISDQNTRPVTVFGKKNIKSLSMLHILPLARTGNGIAIEILGRKDNVIFGPYPLSDSAGYIQAYYGDLNHDGRQDFIIFDWSMGCGLAAGNCDVTFVLSKKDTYNITTIFTMFPDAHDFVDIKGNGTCQFIHTSFIYGYKGKDGKEHNYWVYNLLDITGSHVVLNNDLDKSFPKWVWYSFKPNHSETTLLTKEQKQRLWRAHNTKIFVDIEK